MTICCSFHDYSLTLLAIPAQLFDLKGFMNARIYPANLKNFTHIQALISKSARMLQSQYYKQSEIETALELVSGIEELIAAGSFLVAEYEKKIIGCGGWAIDVAEP